MAEVRKKINVRLFQQASLEYLAKFEDPSVPEGFPLEIDSNCDDLKTLTKFEIAENAISKKMEYDQMRAAQGEEAVSDELILELARDDERPCLLKSVASFRNRDPREVKVTKAKKQINYIASMMKEPQEVEDRPIQPGEVLLTVALYHASKPMKQQEFQVLGSQPLTALRDRLYCLSDYLLDGQQCRSGYFFIENVFYNDMRAPDSQDHSKLIIDWVGENNRFTQPGLGVFAQKKMEDTTFLDLTLRIGAPYLYCHQGNCEHAIVFTEIRLVNSGDMQNFNAYPRHIFQAKIRRRKCKICDIFPARYVTYGDRMATEDPFFYCEHCYRPLHYDAAGRILYSDFEVFPYYHE
eukprot:gnl/Trimastix_PCT/898.p1 GENE.gnl/Trimastix_PCT/898~~gnl/Trimastix_PCT/898.p1  ORF type:complete len:351 (-),score=112.88 gnl/Trimastix_PCT/898:17-1069(-)